MDTFVVWWQARQAKKKAAAQEKEAKAAAERREKVCLLPLVPVSESGRVECRRAFSGEARV